MRTDVSIMMGVEFPIFAFSHCRDVVIAVSRAGGFGVLGAGRLNADQLEIELTQIESALHGLPYGVDLLFPREGSSGSVSELINQIPSAHREFVDELMSRYNVPPLREQFDPNDWGQYIAVPTVGESLRLAEVVASHKPRAVASGLGPPPPDVMASFREQGLALMGLAGTVRHAERHARLGMDVVVATGTEAGGHTGEISTLVLVPDVVDAVSPVPVLAAGGIGDGRQVAAAMALGAQGVWTGSIWLTTAESDVPPLVKSKLLGATATDTLRTRCISGKTSRHLRTDWETAWEQPDAPEPLRNPLQGLLCGPARRRINEHEVEPLMGTAVGQVVGRIDRIRSSREVMYDLVQGFISAASVLSGYIADP